MNVWVLTYWMPIDPIEVIVAEGAHVTIQSAIMKLALLSRLPVKDIEFDVDKDCNSFQFEDGRAEVRRMKLLNHETGLLGIVLETQKG